MIDDLERQAAAEIEQSHLRWMVMWGCYSRLFWAFPRFLVPKGTIISAPDRDRLLVGMRSVEAEAGADSRVPAFEPPRQAARLPVRSTPQRPAPQRATPQRPAPQRRTPLRAIPGQAQRGALPVTTAPGGASGWQDEPERADYDPYDFDPYVSDPFLPDPEDSDRYGSDPLGSDRRGFDPDDYHASRKRL
jgi:hypothetical protein